MDRFYRSFKKAIWEVIDIEPVSSNGSADV
jgi:hypothetical protein